MKNPPFSGPSGSKQKGIPAGDPREGRRMSPVAVRHIAEPRKTEKALTARDKALKRQSAIQAGINEILSANLSFKTQRELGLFCLDIAEKITQSRMGFIGVINKNGLARLVSCSGGKAGERPRADFKDGPVADMKIGGIFGRVLKDGKSLFTNDPAHHPDAIGVPKGHPPVKSFLGVPFLRDGRVTGMVAVANREGGYTRAEKAALEALTPAIAQVFESKRAEEALRQSEKLHRIIFELGAVGMVYISPDGRFLHFNDKFSDITGYSKAELGEMGVFDLIPPEDRENAAAQLAAYLDMERPEHQVENRFIRKDGALAWVSVTARMVCAMEGAPVNYICFVEDITDRKQAEQELAGQRQLLETVINCIPVATNLVRGRDMTIQLVNPAYQAIAPYKEMLGKTYEEVWPETGRCSWRCRSVLETGVASHAVDDPMEVRCAPGAPAQTRYFTWWIYRVRLPGDQGWGLLNTALDTTEYVKAQNELRQSEEMHRLFFESGAAGMIYIDRKGRFLCINDKYCEITGYEKPELERMMFCDLTHPDDREGDRREFRLYVRGKRSSYKREKRYLRKDGSVAWVSETAQLVRDPKGRVHHSTAIVEDITARKLKEQKIARIKIDLEELVAKRTKALRRANQALLMLKKCSEVLARATDETELFRRICEILVAVGGAKMAWVGFAEHHREKPVCPVASAGNEDGYLAAARITWADEPRGRGPTGESIRNCAVSICRDIANDPRMLPWRAEQLRRGFAAIIALPLIVEDGCRGALTIYSPEAEMFNAEEVELLSQLARDLSFGIVALRARAERLRLQRELLRISEREKQLISQELHDGLCQNLAGTAMMGGLLCKRLVGRNDKDAELAKEICDMLSVAVNEARHLSHGLQPVGPEADGLMNALAQLAVTVSNLFCIDCSFDCPEPVGLENEVASTHLLRIAQEAVNNARKHGRATKVVLGLKNTPDGLVLSIRDNGVGIPKKLSSKGGMGLRSMRNRATEIGAAFGIGRGERKGTVVTCVLPRGSAAAAGG